MFQTPAPNRLPRFAQEFTYLIGEPGAGKTTLARHICRGVPFKDFQRPFAHRMYVNGVIELGRPRLEFGGTDVLSMSIQPVVLEWLRTTRPFKVFAEGDRLTNASFFTAVKELGYNLHLYIVWGEEAAELHRALRGSDQDAKWVDGRRSKVRNLKSLPHVELPAGAPLGTLEQMMNDPISEAMRSVRSGRH